MLGLKSGTVGIVPYDPQWRNDFATECRNLQDLIGDCSVEIQHVGSTSIDNCNAKPIIDIAVGVVSLKESETVISILTGAGYDFLGDAGIPGRYFFAKGTRELRTHYIHVEELGGNLWMNHLVFRDMLKGNKKLVDEYSRLKSKLATEFPGDREKYTEQKSDFIKKVICRGLAVLKTNTEEISFSEVTALGFGMLYDYVKEFNACGEERYSTIKSAEDLKDFVETLENAKAGKNLKPGYVASETHFFVTKKGKVVGRVDYRKELTENLITEGGHIGYEICPSERNKGICTAMVGRFLKEKVSGPEKVLVTCFVDNESSERVILSLGGIYEDTRISPRNGKPTKRFWIDLE